MLKMKNTGLLLLSVSLLLGLFSLGAAAAETDKPATPQAESYPAASLDSIPVGHKQAYFKVEGMCCASCAQGCTTAVQKIAGVDSASGDTTSGILVAVYDPDKVKDSDVEAAIVKAGYKSTGRGQGGVWSRTKLSDGSIKLALEVRGMTCTGCSGSIEAGVGQLPGVKSVKASHTAHSCVVEYDPAKGHEADFVATIAKLHYKVCSDPAGVQARRDSGQQTAMLSSRLILL